MAKLGARDRAQLVIIAYETGLVRPGLPCPDRAAGPGVNRLVAQPLRIFLPN